MDAALCEIEAEFGLDEGEVEALAIVGVKGLNVGRDFIQLDRGYIIADQLDDPARSEERRVGKECRL